MKAAALVVILFGSAFSALQASAQSLQAPQSETACAIAGFVTDTDPKGLNVRAAPSASAKILGTLPPPVASKDIPDLKVMAEVEIAAAREGWLKIRNARDNTGLTGAAPRRMFDGSGWVSGRKLAVKTQGSAGYDRPGAGARVIAEWPQGQTIDDDQFVGSSQLIACDGEWALIEFGPFGDEVFREREMTIAPAARAGLPMGKFRAWFNRICAIQETACSG